MHSGHTVGKSRLCWQVENIGLKLSVWNVVRLSLHHFCPTWSKSRLPVCWNKSSLTAKIYLFCSIRQRMSPKRCAHYMTCIYIALNKTKSQFLADGAIVRKRANSSSQSLPLWTVLRLMVLMMVNCTLYVLSSESSLSLHRHHLALPAYFSVCRITDEWLLPCLFCREVLSTDFMSLW